MVAKRKVKDTQDRPAHSEALLIKVKVFAEAKKPEARKEGDRFFVYVKSKRREGKANDEAIELLANLLNIPQKRIVIIKGAQTPNKIIKIITQTAE